MRCGVMSVCRLEEFRIRAKGFGVDTHGGDAGCLDGPRDVTNGHMANGSASGQEDPVHAGALSCTRRGMLVSP